MRARYPCIRRVRWYNIWASQVVFLGGNIGIVIEGYGIEDTYKQ